jgi:hypothetical protein
MPAGDTGVRVATGLALAFAITLLIVVIWAAHPAPVPAPGARGTDPVLVGVVQGQSVPGYLDSSRGELDSLPRAPAGTPIWALVSLAGYYAPDRLAPVLGGAAVAQVYARAPIRDTRTQVVRIPAYRLPDDVVAGMLAAAVHRDREQADYRRLGRDLDGAGPQVSRLRRAYESAASVAAAEAHAYRAHCACVFAAVVRADPLALRRIADRAEVRAVDPAPEVGAPETAEFRPPLPEQSGALPELTRSATTPAPSGAQAVAPARPAPLPSASGSSVTSDSPDGPGTGSGPSAPASEERPAVPSASAPIPGSDAPVTAPGASRGASGR